MHASLFFFKKYTMDVFLRFLAVSGFVEKRSYIVCIHHYLSIRVDLLRRLQPNAAAFGGAGDEEDEDDDEDDDDDERG